MTRPTLRPGRPAPAASTGRREADSARADVDLRRWPSRRFAVDPASSPTPTAALAWFVACHPVG